MAATAGAGRRDVGGGRREAAGYTWRAPGNKSAGPAYGCGSRPTAPLSARALSETPISVSSAAAWTAVLRTRGRLAGAGGRPAATRGNPRGWAGWGSRWRRARVVPVLGRALVAAGFAGLTARLPWAPGAGDLAALAVGFARALSVSGLAGLGADVACVVDASCDSDGGRAGRLSLRL